MTDMVGTGMVGGKTCGMLLARAIIRNLAPDINSVLEPHDSFYVGSDVFYTYIVDNDFWDLRIRQRTEEGYFALADELAKHLKTGTFSPDTREHNCIKSKSESDGHSVVSDSTTQRTVACQAPLSVGFSRQEY